MPTYYSPSGNPEIWADGTQPGDYMTQGEWAAAHPAPATPAPTADVLFSALRAGRDAKLRDNYDLAIAQLTRDLRLATTDEERAAIAAKIAAWDAYAVALCDLPAQDGAPWDGGGEATPWPMKPVM